VSTLSPQVHELARRQHGMIASEQLTALGVSPGRRRRLLGSGVFIRVHPAVFRFAAVPDTFEGRCAAACLADSTVVISGVTAGRLRRLRGMPDGPIHAMTVRRKLDLDGVVIHRTNQLHPDYDVEHRSDGIRLLKVPRLIFDLARFLDDVGLESVIEQVLHRNMTNVPRLFATGRRLSRMGRDGTTRFARVLGKRPRWMKPKQSDHEVRVLAALRAAGVELIAQQRVELLDGTVVHLDGGDPLRRFGVEVDHITWHGGRLAGQYDKWRDRQLHRVGWYAPRVTDEDLDGDFEGIIQELVELYHARDLA
jgi:very-short-patch-repair endonuclease